MSKFKFAAFNKERKFHFNVDSIRDKYIKASELGKLIEQYGEGYIFTIRGLYLGEIDASDSVTGKQQDTASIATDFTYVNAPSFQYDEIAAMIDDRDAVDCINAGGAGFIVEPYQARNKTFYKLVWVDIESGDTVD